MHVCVCIDRTSCLLSARLIAASASLAASGSAKETNAEPLWRVSSVSSLAARSLAAESTPWPQ